MKFYVWDELNSSREHADAIEAYDAEVAAIEYAEEDSDGHCDGIYDKGHPVMVESEDGTRERFEVTAEPSVEFYATAVKDHVTLKITRCEQCPYFARGKSYSLDGFDRGRDLVCKHKRGRVIAKFVEWHEDDPKTIPGWCPLRKGRGS